MNYPFKSLLGLLLKTTRMIFRPNFQFVKWIWQSYKDIVFSVPGVPIDWFRNVINISLLEGLSFGLYICINCNGVKPKKTYSNFQIFRKSCREIVDDEEER